LSLLEEGGRQVDVPVTLINQTYTGLSAHMRLKQLDELSVLGPRRSGAYLRLDPLRLDEIYAAIKQMPAAASLALRETSLRLFRETIRQNIFIMTTVYVVLSVIIAFGVVYNSARIQLSERARELASLRVLGFTGREVATVIGAGTGDYRGAGPAAWLVAGSRVLLGRGTGLPERRIPGAVHTRTPGLRLVEHRGGSGRSDLRHDCHPPGFQSRSGQCAQGEGIGKRHGSKHQGSWMVSGGAGGGSSGGLVPVRAGTCAGRRCRLISRGAFEVTVTEEGETRVKEVYRISAPIAGKLERLTLHAGDRVASGERVASLRPVDPPIRDVRSRLELAAATRAAEAAVGLAQAQVRQAQSALRFAKADFERASELVRRRVISQAQMDQSELQIRVKEAELKQAEAALSLREQELQSARAREMEPLQLGSTDCQ
jgi:hypothetical protein